MQIYKRSPFSWNETRLNIINNSKGELEACTPSEDRKVYLHFDSKGTSLIEEFKKSGFSIKLLFDKDGVASRFEFLAEGVDRRVIVDVDQWMNSPFKIVNGSHVKMEEWKLTYSGFFVKEWHNEVGKWELTVTESKVGGKPMPTLIRISDKTSNVHTYVDLAKYESTLGKLSTSKEVGKVRSSAESEHPLPFGKRERFK